MAVLQRLQEMELRIALLAIQKVRNDGDVRNCDVEVVDRFAVDPVLRCEVRPVRLSDPIMHGYLRDGIVIVAVNEILEWTAESF